MNNTASIVSKVWSFCHTLRDDGVSYGDYLEQLTYLLFLKMADEYSKIYKKFWGTPYSFTVSINTHFAGIARLWAKESNLAAHGRSFGTFF